MIYDSPRTFVVDASVLIDYVKTDEGILALVARHLGAVLIPVPVLDEVNQLSAADCERLGLRLEQPTPQQLLEAGSLSGRLSFQDWVCFLIARDHEATCVTSEKPLRMQCLSASVETLWGLELMLELVGQQHLDSTTAVETAEDIHRMNPFITAEIVARFRRKVHAKRS